MQIDQMTGLGLAGWLREANHKCDKLDQLGRVEVLHLKKPRGVHLFDHVVVGSRHHIAH